MDKLLHLTGQKVINHALARHSVFTIKRLCNHGNAEMTFAASIVSGMAAMKMTFVLDLQNRRLQTLCQFLANNLFHFLRHFLFNHAGIIMSKTCIKSAKSS